MNDEARGGVETVQLSMDGYQGPLDLLLDLARRQQVDLARISIAALTDQFVAAVTSRDRTDLVQAADWLVMAAWLVWLKSRLLLPTDTAEVRQARESAEVLTARLAALERIRAASEWLERQPRLGRDVFGRGFRDEFLPIRLRSGYVDLMEAALLALRGASPPDEPHRYQPPALRLWTAHQALARMRQLIAESADERDLLAFLPNLTTEDPAFELQRCAATASTLVAALELARGSELEARQDELFGRIAIRPAPSFAAARGPADRGKGEATQS